jgi:hypothetical protein
MNGTGYGRTRQRYKIKAITLEFPGGTDNTTKTSVELADAGLRNLNRLCLMQWFGVLMYYAIFHIARQGYRMGK